MSFFKLYLSSFMFLRKLLSFQVVRNSVIEIQIIKKTDNHSQDSAMSSSWTILKMGFYFIKTKLYLHQYCSRGWSIITSLKKLRFFDPPNSHHHVSLRIIYVLSDIDICPLSLISLFWSWRKTSDVQPPMTHPVMFLNN